MPRCNNKVGRRNLRSSAILHTAMNRKTDNESPFAKERTWPAHGPKIPSIFEIIFPGPEFRMVAWGGQQKQKALKQFVIVSSRLNLCLSIHSRPWWCLNSFEARTYNDKLLQCFFVFVSAPRHHPDSGPGNDSKMLGIFWNHEPATSVLLQTAIRCPSLRFIAGAISADDSQVSSADLVVTSRIIFRVIVHEAYCENCHCSGVSQKSGSPLRLKRAPRVPFPLNDSGELIALLRELFTRHVRYAWM